MNKIEVLSKSKKNHKKFNKKLSWKNNLKPD